uniref:Uncharacterized protein n=1 Tax=Anguilla anguilla TaxID=7936 RepID=A0A0E9WNX8_ANGAN
MVLHPPRRIHDAGRFCAVPDTCCSACVWWPNGLLSNFQLVFPPFWPLPVYPTETKENNGNGCIQHLK